MIFNQKGPYSYASAMDPEYHLPNSTMLGVPFYGDPAGGAGSGGLSAPIDAPSRQPILSVGELGQTVGEGHGAGSFIESLQAAIKMGGSHVELSMSASGQEPGVGPDLYTKEKRLEIREIAKANQINIASVHTPVQVVANVSGFAGEQRGFMDEHRHIQLTEVKKAIQFAADTTEGSAIVVHTGEFQRPFTEQSWHKTKFGEFRYYEEEPERFTAFLVDDRTGKIIGEAKKTQIVYEPLYKTAKTEGLIGKKDVSGHEFKPNDWIDMQGNWINPDDPDKLFERVPEWDSQYTRFKTIPLKWDDFRERANDWNERHKNEISSGKSTPISAEEMFWKTQMHNNALRSRGASLFHGRMYEAEKKDFEEMQKYLDYFKEIENRTPVDEQWKLLKQNSKLQSYVSHEVGMLIGTEQKLPSEILQKAIERRKHDLRYQHEASAAADAEADKVIEDAGHVVNVAKYAKRKSMESYAELGVYAMEQTKDRNLKKPLFVAPENIFPESGYGSHPDELIELVQNARQAMTEKLIKERGWDATRAQKASETHIRATLDTEHLGMWKKHFIRNPGESEEKFNTRFNDWYLEQVKKMQDSGIIGHLHIADGFGFGHGNLPAGQGNMPIVSAVEYLKKKGYTGAFLSEGYGDAPRMMRDAWRAFGSPIYSLGGPMRGSSMRWNDVQFSYFGRNEPPHYIFGAYAPSNDWSLWSEVPFE